jgi:hypothetical protein
MKKAQEIMHHITNSNNKIHIVVNDKPKRKKRVIKKKVKKDIRTPISYSSNNHIPIQPLLPPRTYDYQSFALNYNGRPPQPPPLFFSESLI